ncbi:acyltransferase family protein [Ruminococcus sp. CLA-AA-H200]|uniref:Acyltransferase family protein n=1 Tax=Ruminococcus turbiniformis TaxID=2881258 RepID=A0ABS8FWF8_9FIRM|nr:acyltransferase family protein [Ruminococcus turbiniformis]MCC2254282.1 acyltransferase family protein [Ruminococcus turbiniformis]
MREKDYNLELIRMVSFILVIAIHVSNYFCRAYGKIPDSEYLFSLAVDTIARVSVPAFFMISGALLLGREEPLEKHGKRLLRFLTVLIVWSAVYYIWNTCYMKSGFDLREILYVPAEAHLWYLYAMIPIYLVLPFFQVMCRNLSVKLEKALLIIAALAVLFNYIFWLMGAEMYYDLPLIGDRVYAYYLFLGYYIYKYREKIPVSQTGAALICAFGMAVSFGVTFAVTVIQGDHYEGALTYGMPSVVLSAAAFFLFMLRLGDGCLKPGEHARRVIDLFCGCSFGIYLIHILFLDNYKKHMEAYDLSAWIAVPGLIVVITAVSFVCVWLMRKTKVGRRIT